MKKFGSIELGIPAYMLYKGVPIGSLTRKTDSIRTKDNKKSIKLIPDTDGKLEIIKKGTRDADGALEFGTAEVEIPATVVKRKRLVKTLTDKTKQPTRRKGVQSIRLRGIDDELGKVRIMNKGQEVAIVERILKKLEEAPIPKKDISALKAKFQMAFKRVGFKKAVEQMREVAKKYAEKEEQEKKKKSEASKKTDDTTEYADKWEWLMAQENWRKILNNAGIKGIPLGQDKEKIIKLVKTKFSRLVLPWNTEQKDREELYKKLFYKFKDLEKIVKSDSSKEYFNSHPNKLADLTIKISRIKFNSISEMEHLLKVDKQIDETEIYITELLKNKEKEPISVDINKLKNFKEYQLNKTGFSEHLKIFFKLYTKLKKAIDEEKVGDIFRVINDMVGREVWTKNKIEQIVRSYRYYKVEKKDSKLIEGFNKNSKKIFYEIFDDNFNDVMDEYFSDGQRQINEQIKDEKDLKKPLNETLFDTMNENTLSKYIKEIGYGFSEALIDESDISTVITRRRDL